MIRFRSKFHHNWFAILYFNFKMLPFKQAIKLPFDFYHKVRFQDLSGRIILNCDSIKRGSYHWGLIQHEIFPALESIISIKGTLIINGSSIAFGGGTMLEINENSVLELNDDLLIAPRTKIILQESVLIGKHVRVGWESQILDSNFHFMRNLLTGEIKKRTSPIKIGNYCWIGNRVTIGKGTVLPDHCIVASNSICNKAFSNINSKSITIAGLPAKQISENWERIFESIEPDIVNELYQKEKILRNNEMN